MIYRIEIKSVLDNGFTITVGSDKTDDLGLAGLSIRYNYLNFSCPGTAVLVGFKNTTFTSDSIRSGYLLFIYENGTRIYAGYILQTTFNESAEFTSMVIEFDTFLSQFSRQMMVSSSQDVYVLSPNKTTSAINADFFSPTLTMQQLITFMISESLFSYAQKYYKYSSSQAKFGIIYEQEEVLSGQTEIYYHPAVGYTKEQVLRETTYPYQSIVYQDPSGNWRFSIPSYSNKSNLTAEIGNPNIIKIQKIDRSALVTNYVVTSFVYFGVFPPTQEINNKNVLSESTPNPTFFSYLDNLLTSNYFTQSLVDYRNYSSDLQKNASLLNALTIFQQSNNSFAPAGIPLNADLTNKTIAPLFSNRILAESLTSANSVVVTMARTPDYTDIPIGKIFTAKQSQWIGISCTLDLSISSGGGVVNTLSIVGAPLSTCTGAWQE